MVLIQLHLSRNRQAGISAGQEWPFSIGPTQAAIRQRRRVHSAPGQCGQQPTEARDLVPHQELRCNGGFEAAGWILYRMAQIRPVRIRPYTVKQTIFSRQSDDPLGGRESRRWCVDNSCPLPGCRSRNVSLIHFREGWVPSNRNHNSKTELQTKSGAQHLTRSFQWSHQMEILIIRKTSNTQFHNSTVGEKKKNEYSQPSKNQDLNNLHQNHNGVFLSGKSRYPL